MTPTLEEFIEAEEWTGKEGLLPNGSYRATYDAVGGCWNIGPGLTQGTNRNTVMTKAEIDAAYAEELAPFEKCVAKAVKVPRTDNQNAALISFAYNVGEGDFLSSSLLRVLNAGHADQVPDQLKRWVHGRATGAQVIPGLVNRRRAECEMWNTPVVPYATVHSSEDVASVQAPPYVPHYDPAYPVPKGAVTLEMIMSVAATLVSVPLSATTAVISQTGHKVITAAQGGLLTFATFILAHFNSAWDLLGVNSSTVSVYAATAIIAGIEWWKHSWVQNSNDTTMAIIDSLEAKLKGLANTPKG